MAFGFTYLTGTEIAGYTSINALITSIDTQLTNRIPNKDTSGTGAYNAYVPVYDSTQASGFSQGLITSSNILNGTILDADINAAAGIVDTKLATISTAAKVSRSAIDTSGSTAGQVLTSTGSSATPTWQAASIGTTNIATAAVTYDKLAADAKTYDVPTSGTGVYFTASGDFTSASLSTASAQNPVVISAASSAIDLSLPNTVGTEGATIIVCQTGTGTVTIKPKAGATATINGSTSVTYTVGAQYSVVTLICLSNSGSNGTWVIIGDYI